MEFSFIYYTLKHRPYLTVDYARHHDFDSCMCILQQLGRGRPKYIILYHISIFILAQIEVEFAYVVTPLVINFICLVASLLSSFSILYVYDGVKMV